MALHVRVLDPDGNEVHKEAQPSREGQISFHAGGRQGPWRICFKTTARYSLGQTYVELSYISVNLKTMKGSKYQKSRELTKDDTAEHLSRLSMDLDPEDVENFASADHVREIQQQVKQLSSTVYHVYYEQRHIKTYNQRHRAAVEEVQARQRWTRLAELLVLAALSVVQVAYVRGLFMEKTAKGPMGPGARGRGGVPSGYMGA